MEISIFLKVYTISNFNPIITPGVNFISIRVREAFGYSPEKTVLRDFKESLHSNNRVHVKLLDVMPKFLTIRVKGETTFYSNSKWKRSWLLNFPRAPILYFMTCYGYRYC